MKNKFKTLLELFGVFAFIGGTTFGGGYAMLPILQREIVEKRKWGTEEELMDYYAIGQCTPGIIAVNTATFIGTKLMGVLGGIVASLGVVFPSVIVITIIAALLTNFADFPVVQHALAGIRCAVCVLILDAVIKLAKKSLKDVFCILIFLAVLLASLLLPISPIWMVIAAGVCGLLLKPIADKHFVKKDKKPAEKK